MLGILKHDPHKHDFNDTYEALKRINTKLKHCKTLEAYNSIVEEYKKIDTATDSIVQYTTEHKSAQAKLTTVQEKIAISMTTQKQKLGITTDEIQTSPLDAVTGHATPVEETDSQKEEEEETSKNKKRHSHKTRSERDSSSEQETTRKHHHESKSQDSESSKKTTKAYHHHHYKVDTVEPEIVSVETQVEQAATSPEHKEAPIVVDTPVEQVATSSEHKETPIVVDTPVEQAAIAPEDKETSKAIEVSVEQATSPEEENDPEMEFLIRGPSFEEESQNQETIQATIERSKRERQLSVYTEWLKKLEEKRDELHARYPQDTEDDASKAYGAACQLVNILNGYIEQYKDQDITLKQFKENSSRVIQDKRQGVLSEHRGFKEILMNLLLAIGTLGVGYAIAAIFKQSLTPIKCNTATVNLLNDVEHKLDEVDNSTSISI